MEMPTNDKARSGPCSTMNEVLRQTIPKATQQNKSPGMRGTIDGYKYNVEGSLRVMANISL